MITVFSDNKEIPVNKVEFSDRAITFKLDKLEKQPRYIHINVCPSTPVNQIREEITMVVSSIQQFYKSSTLKGLRFPVTLDMPYVGYGRADRCFEVGNPTTPLFTFLTFLDKMGFDKINMKDLHNPSVLEDWYFRPLDTTTNFYNKPQLECFKESLPYDFNEEYTFVVAPDKGAMDKASTIAEHLAVDIVFAGKKRCIETGRILETTLPEDIDLKGAKVLIPDDIFDGGFTFIKLAEKLKERGVKEIHLYITHIIASKGLNYLTGLIDKVYYNQVVGTHINDKTILDFNSGKL